MRQRARIALALACSPAVLLADEPTTALDVTVAQSRSFLLLRQLQQELGMAIVFVTHDVGAAAEISDRIAVMHTRVALLKAVRRGRLSARRGIPTPKGCWPRPCMAECAARNW